MTATEYHHIELDDQRVPHIAGTRTKVVEVVLDRLAYHWDADEIHRQHPHLSLAQIHAALAYYYDHQSEMDAELQRRLGVAEQSAAQQPPSPVRAKLLEEKRRRLGHF